MKKICTFPFYFKCLIYKALVVKVVSIDNIWRKINTSLCLGIYVPINTKIYLFFYVVLFIFSCFCAEFALWAGRKSSFPIIIRV